MGITPFNIPLSTPIAPPVQTTLNAITPDSCIITSHINFATGGQVFDSVNMNVSIFGKAATLQFGGVQLATATDFASLMTILQTLVKSHIDANGNII